MAFKNLANGYRLTFGELQLTSLRAFAAAVSAPVFYPHPILFLQALLCLVTLVVTPTLAALSLWSPVCGLAWLSSLIT